MFWSLKKDHLKFKKRNKILLSPFWLVLAFSFFLSSCSWWERKILPSTTEGGDLKCRVGNAPFIVNQVAKSHDDAISRFYEDGLVEEFSLNLKTCIRDALRQDTPIQNTSFVIEYYSSTENRKKGIKEQERVISDTQGCIQWQERYEYKYTVKPLWIGLERVIKKEGGAYAGAEAIPMAVNPWLSSADKREDGLPSVLDIRCGYSDNHHVLKDKGNYNPKGLDYLEAIRLEEQPVLWASRISLQMREIGPETSDSSESSNSSALSKEEKIRKLLAKYQNPCGSGVAAKLCYQRRINMDIYVPLELRSLDVNRLVENKLNGGSYDVETRLVISPESDRKNYQLHKELCQHKGIKLNQSRKSLSWTCKLNLSYFNQNAQYKLVLQIKPSSRDLPFKKFEGVYTINLNFNNETKDFPIDTIYDQDYEEVLNTNKVLGIIKGLKIHNIFSFLDALVSDNDNPEELQREPLKPIYEEGVVKGVDFYPLHLDGSGDYKLSHIQTGETCSERENVVQRTVVFIGKICLTDVLESRKLKHTSFRVFREQPREGFIKEIYDINEHQQRKLFKTDGDSCISIPIDIKHNIYNRQKYFQVDLHVLSERLNLYGKVRLALSPWQRAFQSFQDAQNLNEKFIRFETEGIYHPELVINQFRSINLFPSYGLDKLLNIHLFHRIYLLFQPFIRRPDNLSFGRDYRSRELLRDGYYLVRVLILRNPQEVGDNKYGRVENQKNQNQQRGEVRTESHINLERPRYITHTDSVVFARANFINFYMPIYLSTKQLYYTASRNIIVIEVHPADPSAFAYNKDCSLDLERTNWKPFVNHELKNSPYAGVMNIQNWMNWNLLQESPLDTDDIIDQFDMAKKYRHFHLSSSISSINSNTAPSSTDVGCVNGVSPAETENIQISIESVFPKVETESDSKEAGVIFEGADPSPYEQSRCMRGEFASAPNMEQYREQEEQFQNSVPSILAEFSKNNSLKLVELNSPQGNEFLEDIVASYTKYPFIQRGEKALAIGDILEMDLIPEEDRKILQARWNQCFIWKSGGIQSHWTKQCGNLFFNSYLKIFQRISKGETSFEILKDLTDNMDFLPAQSQRELSAIVDSCFPSDYQNCYDKTKAHVSSVLDLFLDHYNGLKRATLKSNFENDSSELYLLEDFSQAIFSLLSKEEKRDLSRKLESCLSSYDPSAIYFNSCYYEKLKIVYNNKQLFEENFAYQQDDWYKKLKGRVSSSSNKNIFNRFISFILESDTSREVMESFLEEPNEANVIHLVKKGIKSSDRYDSNTLSFITSLCGFWFDSYIKKYIGKEEMLSAYTNYIQKFDYQQVLHHSSITYIDDKGNPEDNPYEDPLKFLDPFLAHLASSESGQDMSECYLNYTKCLVLDHCQERGINTSKNEICADKDVIQDFTCPKLVKEECKKDSSLSICADECSFQVGGDDCKEQGYCHQIVRDFCILNGDQNICERYNNRCFVSYQPCINETSKEAFFDVERIIDSTQMKKLVGNSPLKTCLQNPYEFFKFENKMIVHELSKNNPKYEMGFTQSFLASANVSVGTYMNWTAQRGRSLSVSAKASVGTGMFSDVFKILKSIPGLELSGSAGQSASSNESNSRRRAFDNRVGEGVYLAVDTAKITIGVTKFQKCLVVKPRPNAFVANLGSGEPEYYENIWQSFAKNFEKIMISHPGLILCSPVESREEGKAENITESYYYISQTDNQQNAVNFLNLYDLANRPLVAVLRGRKEFIKMYEMLKRKMDGDNGRGFNSPPENMFINYPFPVEKAIGLNLARREFNETGFHEGVYDYPDDSDEILEAWYANIDKKQPLMDPLTYNNMFDVPKVQDTTVPVQK